MYSSMILKICMFGMVLFGDPVTTTFVPKNLTNATAYNNASACDSNELAKIPSILENSTTVEKTSTALTIFSKNKLQGYEIEPIIELTKLIAPYSKEISEILVRLSLVQYCEMFKTLHKVEFISFLKYAMPDNDKLLGTLVRYNEIVEQLKLLKKLGYNKEEIKTLIKTEREYKYFTNFENLRRDKRTLEQKSKNPLDYVLQLNNEFKAAYLVIKDVLEIAYANKDNLKRSKYAMALASKIYQNFFQEKTRRKEMNKYIQRAKRSSEYKKLPHYPVIEEKIYKLHERLKLLITDSFMFQEEFVTSTTLTQSLIDGFEKLDKHINMIIFYTII